MTKRPDATQQGEGDVDRTSRVKVGRLATTDDGCGLGQLPPGELRSPPAEVEKRQRQHISKYYNYPTNPMNKRLPIKVLHELRKNNN